MIHDIINSLQVALHKAEVKNEIHTRLKDPYSVLKKMKRKKVSVTELKDLIAIRIIVPSKEECYKALHVIDSFTHFILKHTKDYINDPKTNGYQSIHSIVKLLYSQRNAEIQIRSHEMHKVAELGRAAHLYYKQGQDQDLEKILHPQHEALLNSASRMVKSFAWNEEEIVAYEQEIMRIWHEKIDEILRGEAVYNKLVPVND